MNEEQIVDGAEFVESDRLRAARMRSAVRSVEARIAEIQAEQRLFRRYNFGSDVHRIQLTALNAERAELLARLRKIPSAQRLPRQSGIESWLLLLPTLGAMAVGSLRPRRRPSTRFPVIGG